jgi:hypothetical protein
MVPAGVHILFLEVGLADLAEDLPGHPVTLDDMPGRTGTAVGTGMAMGIGTATGMITAIGITTIVFPSAFSRIGIRGGVTTITVTPTITRTTIRTIQITIRIAATTTTATLVILPKALDR